MHSYKTRSLPFGFDAEWVGWVNVYSNEGILEKEIKQNKNAYEWDSEVESNLLRGTWRFLHTSRSCEHRPPSTQCTCFKGSRKHFSKLALHPLEEQPAAVGVASHLFGFHIFLHSVLPVLLVALSYFLWHFWIGVNSSPRWWSRSFHGAYTSSQGQSGQTHLFND